MRLARARRRILVALAASLWSVAFVAEQSARADSGSQERDSQDKTRPRRRSELSKEEREELAKAAKRTVSPRNNKILIQARDFLLAQDYAKALEAIDRINIKRANAYERALTYRTRGYIAHGQEKYDEAIGHLRQAISEDGLSRSDHADVLFQIATIYNSQAKWREAVATLKEWFAVAEQPGSAAYIQLALAYYQLNDLDAALDAAKKGVALAEVPQQPWLQLLLALHLVRQNYSEATPVLVRLLTLYPKAGATYWIQLATLYGLQEDIPRALAVLELAHRQDLLTLDRDLRRLAQLSLSQDMPIRSVRVIEASLESKRMEADAAAYELLGNSWILARESANAEPPLARAAELSPKGNLYLRLAQVLMLHERWSDAATALRQAVAKGGIDDPSSADLLLGITYYNSRNPAEARSWFTRARRSEKMRASADSWIRHIDVELQGAQTSASSSG
ncbi:MAG TPA: tetratricopeptide repeat protein [Myxococcota bacterium]|nr:tetratricopeptide repeat protein [Myxococcota bacterium]